MEECPKCKNWTLFYDPQSESKMCWTCDFREKVKYDLYIKESNVVTVLKYPSRLAENITKAIPAE